MHTLYIDHVRLLPLLSPNVSIVASNPSSVFSVLVYYPICVFLRPKPNCLDYCSSGASFKFGKFEPSNIFFFCKIVLAIWDSLQFYMNCRTSLSISSTKGHWNLESSFVEPDQQLGEYYHLTNITSFCQWTLAIYLFRFSLILTIFCSFPCTALGFI